MLRALQSGRALLSGRAGRRAASAQAAQPAQPPHATQAPVLTRDFIQDALYNPDYGYFCKSGGVVGSVPEPIDFPALLGRWDYQRAVKRVYDGIGDAWLTPAEIFAPHYSRALAAYALAQLGAGERLRVLEIGGGNGTNALHFLRHVRDAAPEVYESTEYTLMDVSPALSEAQAALLAPEHGHAVRCVRHDALAWEGEPLLEPCFVVALEVLDNLPHDKVRLQDGRWHETVVTGDADGGFEEQSRPAADPWVLRALQLFPPRKPRKGDGAAFLPTGAAMLAHMLHRRFPRHRLVAADFDYLPKPSVGRGLLERVFGSDDGPVDDAIGAPLVAGPGGRDLPRYTVGRGTADIFFPTNFTALRLAYAQVAQRPLNSVTVQSSAEFMQQWADLKATETRSGYNPMVDDFSNTRVLLS